MDADAASLVTAASSAGGRGFAPVDVDVGADAEQVASPPMSPSPSSPPGKGPRSFGVSWGVSWGTTQTATATPGIIRHIGKFDQSRIEDEDAKRRRQEQAEEPRRRLPPSDEQRHARPGDHREGEHGRCNHCAHRSGRFWYVQRRRDVPGRAVECDPYPPRRTAHVPLAVDPLAPRDILREIDRGGQVYFLHNFVESIAADGVLQNLRNVRN
jgi:hypothetical protein